ncbi:hypothetical protein DMC30DRAFT_399603 [Rhodotorula diobovata]|uniref:Transmembrane protein n=1 Tax=Rhodotorula diobovata TaxID=5288 RepID=A0A5C5FVP2_9BASI|nr:hypothetical protein DMC30DRAFT_399603 [Rhodotorula diobovata]
MVPRTRAVRARATALPAPASTPVLVPSTTPPRPEDPDKPFEDAHELRSRHEVARDAHARARSLLDSPEDAIEPSTADDDDDDGTSMMRWGIALVAGSASCFALGLWSILIGPFCAPTGVRVLDAMAQDTHYKYLVVLLVPVTVCFVIVNWWGLKILRHA